MWGIAKIFAKNFSSLAKIRHSENFAMSAKFSLCLLKIFFLNFFLEKQNKINNK